MENSYTYVLGEEEGVAPKDQVITVYEDAEDDFGTIYKKLVQQTSYSDLQQNINNLTGIVANDTSVENTDQAKLSAFQSHLTAAETQLDITTKQATFDASH